MKFVTSILSPERPFLFHEIAGFMKLLDICELYPLFKLLDWAENKIGCSIEWYFSSTFATGSGPHIMLLNLCI